MKKTYLTKIFRTIFTIIIVCLIVAISIFNYNKPKINSDLCMLEEISHQIEDIRLQKADKQLQIEQLQNDIANLEEQEAELNNKASNIFAILMGNGTISPVEKEEWQPGDLTEDGDHQEMPQLSGDISDTHERFKQLATAYGLDAGMIWNVENHYGIKEGVVLCVTVAETSGGNRGAGGKNIGSVGSNDRGERPTYALMEAGLEAIGKTLSNRYLGSKQSLGCLSNAGSCIEPNDNGKRYATSEHSREANMVACLSEIYGPIDAKTFNIRRG